MSFFFFSWLASENFSNAAAVSNEYVENMALLQKIKD